MTLKSDAKFEEKPICCFKIDKNLMNFDTSTQKHQKSALWLVPFVYTEVSCKIWRKTDLWFQRWQEFGKFSPEHLEVL